MRHAKSSWDDANLCDHARPLNKRGRRAANAVGKALHDKGYTPDLIWSSDAERAKETALRLMRALPGAQHAIYGPDFYHASSQDVISICDQQGEPDVSKLMLIGHNPGWSDLFTYFSGKTHKFPTGACAIFRRQVNKSDGEIKNWLEPDNWEFEDLILPRELNTNDN